MEHRDVPTTPRRDFVRAFALTAIATPLVRGDAPPPSVDEPAKPPEKSRFDEEVDARLAIVFARFGKHQQLDAKARETIRAEIAGIVRRGEALRKVALGNGDGPFPVFHPFRSSPA